MTERRAHAARLPVGWLSLAVFLVVLTLLALQLRAGRDPALGHKGASVAPRRVVVRRIVRRVVVVHVIPAPNAAAGSSSSGSSAAAPAVSASAPVNSAPAPAPAPVPAAPAPVTRSS